MPEYTTDDMIGSVLDRQPDQFKTAFNDIMIDKVGAALEIKRQEVAKNYFNTSEDEQELETEEQDGQDSETDA